MSFRGARKREPGIQKRPHVYPDSGSPLRGVRNDAFASASLKYLLLRRR